MGVFLCCWAPFFAANIVYAYCNVSIHLRRALFLGEGKLNDFLLNIDKASQSIREIGFVGVSFSEKVFFKHIYL